MVNYSKINPEHPILIAGPTASGKSALALKLAQKYQGIIVNADALQVYGCWKLLSARPGSDDLACAPHHLYGHVACDHKYSVGAWLKDFKKISVDNPGRTLIVVGGTGLYFSSLTNGLAEIPNVDNSVRNASEALLMSEGLAAMIAELERDDPVTLAKIDRQNPMRVQRAWEVLRSSGRGLAAWHAETPAPMVPLRTGNALVMDAPKTWLNPRIERRFSQMISNGCLEEVRKVEPNWDASLPSAKAIGAPELIAHLRGEMALEDAIDAACLATRQYAKRQRSWFRARMKDWSWQDLST